jgi:hypothetical protein
MDAGLAWTIVGSVAGVAAVGTVVVFGVLQLRQGHKSSPVLADGDPAAPAEPVTLRPPAELGGSAGSQLARHPPVSSPQRHAVDRG